MHNLSARTVQLSATANLRIAIRYTARGEVMAGTAKPLSIPIPNPLDLIPGWGGLNINPFAGLDNWFKNIGGQIASGIEGGFVAIIKDLWDVVIGPLEIAAGVIVAIMVIVFMFKDDLAAIAPIVGAVAL